MQKAEPTQTCKIKSVIGFFFHQPFSVCYGFIKKGQAQKDRDGEREVNDGSKSTAEWTINFIS